MTLVAMLFGMIIGLAFAGMLILAGIYSVLIHIMPADELRAFITEIRTSLRKKNKPKTVRKK